jgi:hypothetical protein
MITGIMVKKIKSTERGGQELTAQPLTVPAANGATRTEALLAERQDAPLTLRRATKIRSRRRRAELIAPSCPL